MISCTSIGAVLLRYARMWRRDPNFLLGGLYWPLLDVLIWGFLGSWIQSTQSGQFQNYEITALLGILLWQVAGRGSNIMITTFNEELWSNNLVNLFSLPLRTIEWIIGVVLFSAVMILITFTFCMGFILILYNVSMWDLFSTFLIFLPPLFFSGIWLGFTSLQIIVILGKRGTELGYVISWFLLPFSGAYYPIDVLPLWGQVLSKYFPLSYVFEGMRRYLMYAEDPTPYLVKGYALSIFYALCAVILFVYFFNRSKQKGLVRLAD